MQNMPPCFRRGRFCSRPQGQTLEQSCQVSHAFPQTDEFFPQGFESCLRFFTQGFYFFPPVALSIQDETGQRYADAYDCN